jgi:hypothetical protein
MKTFCIAITLPLLLLSSSIFGQGLVTKTLTDPNDQELIVGCGSHHFIKHQDGIQEGYQKQADELIREITKTGGRSSSSNEIITIPVVFHILYNSTDENLHDSIILDQLRIMNESFRRKNADTVNTRTDFKNVVGDARIEFELAKVDPDGKPTNGITRTSTSVTHFGGLLPFSPGQNAQITKWVTDSFNYNLFRITEDKLGGKSSWDPKAYLNIWIGDLRISEPKFNNFEELVFLGLATNPKGHKNWPDSVLPDFVVAEGALIHYVSVGSNNPNLFPAAYQTFNSTAKTGKITVHEVGHYLGLRHIWGDGDCTKDDFIGDTPLATNHSQWACNPAKNTCVDPGTDLPDMIENYMDYSSGDCQNSFTKAQADVMREVYLKYRKAQPAVGTSEINNSMKYRAFPNPTTGPINIEFENAGKGKVNIVQDVQGRIIINESFELNEPIHLRLNSESGIYFVNMKTEYQSTSFKVVKE